MRYQCLGESQQYGFSRLILAKHIRRINLLEYSLLIVSVLSIGHISTTALAAITIGEMTLNVIGLSIIMGFASALDTVLPSAWTSERPELVGLWTQRMMLIVCLTLVPIITLWLNAEAILLKLKQEPEVARLATVYLRCMCIGVPGASCRCMYFISFSLSLTQPLHLTV